MNADTLTCLTCATQRSVPNARTPVNIKIQVDCRKCGGQSLHIAGTSKIARAQHADTRKTRTA